LCYKIQWSLILEQIRLTSNRLKLQNIFISQCPVKTLSRINFSMIYIYFFKLFLFFMFNGKNLISLITLQYLLPTIKGISDYRESGKLPVLL